MDHTMGVAPDRNLLVSGKVRGRRTISFIFFHLHLLIRTPAIPLEPPGSIQADQSRRRSRRRRRPTTRTSVSLPCKPPSHAVFLCSKLKEETWAAEVSSCFCMTPWERGRMRSCPRSGSGEACCALHARFDPGSASGNPDVRPARAGRAARLRDRRGRHRPDQRCESEAPWSRSTACRCPPDKFDRLMV